MFTETQTIDFNPLILPLGPDLAALFVEDDSVILNETLSVASRLDDLDEEDEEDDLEDDDDDLDDDDDEDFDDEDEEDDDEDDEDEDE